MELDVTRIIEAENFERYSDSIARSGLQNIGEITWRNACESCAELDTPLVTEPQQDELIDWFADFGAWSRDELEAMTPNERCALLLQFISGDAQEYFEAEERGELASYLENHGGRLYRGDDDRWYFYVGC